MQSIGGINATFAAKPSTTTEHVITAAAESISQIIIKDTPAYLFGEAISSTNSSDVVVIPNVRSGNTKNIVMSITSKEEFSLYNSPNAYAHRYLKSPNGELYDILAPSSTAVSDKLNVLVYIYLSTNSHKCKFRDSNRNSL